jgi:phage terminase Nu1 subunit (DNA packaging protein)
MPRKTITLEIDGESEELLRRYAVFLEEMNDLAASAPDGSVLDTCEEAVIEKGREQQRLVLERAVQARLDAAEKKGRR